MFSPAIPDLHKVTSQLYQRVHFQMWQYYQTVTCHTLGYFPSHLFPERWSLQAFLSVELALHSLRIRCPHKFPCKCSSAFVTWISCSNQPICLMSIPVVNSNNSINFIQNQRCQAWLRVQVQIFVLKIEPKQESQQSVNWLWLSNA